MVTDVVTSPFGESKVATVPQSGTVAVEQQRAVSEVQVAMILARSNPRDQVKAMDLILQDCMRPALAEHAIYDYAKGGTSITGASIRLIESIARRWGNVRSGIKEIARNAGYSDVVAYAWDLETGYYDERVFQVRHWRDTRSGGYPIKDEREIYELTANMGQRRKRAVLQTILPADVVEAAVAQCEATMKAKADTSPDAMAKMLEAFAEFGVKREHIEKRIQRRIDSITAAQVVGLKKVYASLRDQMSVPGDWFDMTPPEPNTPGVTTVSAVAEQLKESIRQRQAMKQQKAAKPEPEQPPAEEPPIAEPPAGLFDTPPTLSELKDRITRATSEEAAALALDQARDVLDATDHAELSEHFKRKWVPR